MVILSDLLNTVRGVLKLNSIKIDNNVFILHYKLTMIFLLVCSLLVTAKQFIGDPIECYLGKQNHRNIDTYCWIHGTFTVKKHLKDQMGKSQVQQGVGVYDGNEEIIVQKYYQWVCLVLALQAVFFYIPRLLWKTWEGGLMKMLVGNLGLPIVSSGSTEEHKRSVLIYFTTRNKMAHNLYAARFVLCEILNAANIMSQFVALNYFLGGEFLYYGLLVAMFSSNATEESIDPMAHLFPKTSKCTFREFGPSGGIDIIDALCVLPLNVINEKIFIVVWYWFVILAAISIFAVLIRFLIVYNRGFRFCFMFSQCRFTERATIKRIVNKLSYGDWYILYMFGKNVNSLIFKELVVELESLLLPEPLYNNASAF